MDWKVEVWEEKNGDINNYTDWATSFFEAFGYFSSCVMDESCCKCIVTAYYLNKPCGDPILVYNS